MSSYAEGKEFMTGWIRGRFAKGDTCLDVGPCDGNWFHRLGSYLTMDAVEIFQPNIDRHRLAGKYRRVWCMDVADLEYDRYDLVLFGDVIEHMPVDRAQKAISYARERCREIIVAVPFLYRQGAMYGNQWERHIQDDLTPELFDERYPGFEMICRPKPNYAYYFMKGGETDDHKGKE